MSNFTHLVQIFYFLLLLKKSNCSLVWYQWPIMWKGVMYEWKELPDGRHETVYLFGNPIVFWIGLAAIFISILCVDQLGFKFLFDKKKPLTVDQSEFLRKVSYCLLGYFANLLPYVLVTRPCYMYHYHPSLYFAIFITGILIDEWLRQPGFLKYKLLFLLALMLLVIYAYFHFLPFSYSIPLTNDEHQQRRWFYSFFVHW